MNHQLNDDSSSKNSDEPLIQSASSCENKVILPPHLRNMVSPSPGPSPVPSPVPSASFGGSPVRTESRADPTDPIKPVADAAAPALAFPGSVRNLWSDFNKNRGDEPASGFVLVDPSNFAPPEKTRTQRAVAYFDTLPQWKRAAVLGGGALLFFFLGSVAFSGTPFMQGVHDVSDHVFVNWKTEYNVAFIGNSYMYVNDVPRLMEAVSEGHIKQNSCINTAGSLGKLLRAGNGMYGRWETESAVLRTNLNYAYDFVDEDYVWYDYGACTVYQLLENYDNDLVYQNYNGAYYSADESNPCFIDEFYLGLVMDKMAKTQVFWDFVVLNDQTKRMAFEDARAESIDALKYAYAPMLRDARAVPIIVDTHAFWSDSGNMTGLQDIAYFTAEIYEGLLQYVFALKYNLPKKFAPRVAPVGLAYLTVYEEDEELWEKLFLADKVHSSTYGSYLFANVLYCTIYGHLPKNARKLGGVASLFAKSRDIQDDSSYPSPREANYLRTVAARVALHKHIPSVLKQYGDTHFHLEKVDASDEDRTGKYWNGMETSTDWDTWDAEMERMSEQQSWETEEADMADGYDYNGRK